MNEEKIVEINGIAISKTGFKNLQFETSRTSDKIHVIRGFGGSMREENLNIIDTVSMDFVLNYHELKELAFIYCLFKANGILPIKNEYLLNKIKSTYEKGKTEEQIKKDNFIKKNVTHLICLLQRMSITSLEKTNNGYKVNLILTLYNNALTSSEFDLYMEKYEKWKIDTNFYHICEANINKLVDELHRLSTLDINIYNSETLNSTYKEHLLNVASSNAKLNSDNKYVNEQKANENIENNIYEILKNNKTLDIKKLGKKIIIPNENILQIELITHNNISAVPIIGLPVMNKSFLGIGETYFSAKLIFNEYDSKLLEQLKTISDKSIIDHKIELSHPLIQLFDFHTSNIINIVFNNVEEANGIMVNIIFSLNGFRYEEESFNSDELLDSFEFQVNHKPEMICGLYFEYVVDFFYKNRKILNFSRIQKFVRSVLESKVFDNYGKSVSSQNKIVSMFSHNYVLMNLMSSYSSFPTSYGTHRFEDNVLLIPRTSFSLVNSYVQTEDLLNSLFNKGPETVKHNKNFLYLNYSIDTEHGKIYDKDLDKFKDFDKAFEYYAYIDNICAISLIGDESYKEEINNILYKTNEDQKYHHMYLFNNVFKKISTELFNAKQNGINDLYKNEVIKKIYEEFYFRLFYILNTKLKEEIDTLRNSCFISSNQVSILFGQIKQTISELSSKLFEEFNNTFYDEAFIERITREIIANKLTAAEKSITDIQVKIKEASENVKQFTLEFENKYKKNKDIIEDRAYNIFLTKISYFLSMYCGTEYFYNKGSKYEEMFDLNIDEPIRIFLLSSAIHSILLLNTDDRTDHFGNSIILGFKNIGYKFSKYNKNLRDKDGNKIMFYELFDDNEPNKYFYYKDKVKFEDFYIFNKKMLDSSKIPNKDINFFFGKKIKNQRLYKDLIDIIIPENFKSDQKNIKNSIRNEISNFIENEEIYPFGESGTFYNQNDLEINNMEFPIMNFGLMPTHYTEKFFTSENCLNTIMKQRVIGNNDPFKNLFEIADIVFDTENYLIPDYEILIFKTFYEKDNVGNVYKVMNGSSSMVLKNAVSINITKNPKNKIKTAKIILNNTSKSIFNFNPVNGSFDMKTLKNGEIDIIHVEPGDELRIRLGFDDKTQIFNGFINIIENRGNSILITGSSFTSVLYNSKITEFAMAPNNLGMLRGIFSKTSNFFKGTFNKMKTTLAEISNSMYQNILNSANGTAPLNNHLFKPFGPDSNSANTVFQDNQKASMYTATILALTSIPTRWLNKFVDGKISDITNSTLASATYVKASLKSALGSMTIQNESTGNTPDLYKNLNNVDMDYEIYGMLRASYQGFFSNNSNVNQTKAFKNNKENIENNNDNNGSFNNDVILNNKNQNVPSISTPDNGNSLSNLPTFNENVTYGITHLPVHPKANLITSLFKERRISGNGYRVHNGIDICNPSGKKEFYQIFAVANGVVIESGAGGAAGNYIKIRHQIPGEEKYFVSAYMHLRKVLVKKGDVVSGGAHIGEMGNTGRSSGTHLHFEMYIINNLNIKTMLLNPFDINALPEHEWKVDWNLVNIFADNGRYTEKWKDAYDHSKKTLAYKGVF